MRRSWNHQPWAPHELAFLQEWYGVLLVQDIADLLRRGIDAVRVKSRELGLRCHTVWTPELDEFLTFLFPDTAATALGPVMGVTPAAVRARAHELGVKKHPQFASRHSRETTLARSAFTPEIVAVLAALYPTTLTEDLAVQVGIPKARIHAYATKMGWKKTREFISVTARARTGPDHPMRKHHFPKGNVPANKGVKGINYPGMVATQFPKGNTPQTWVPIGTYRVNGDGYLDLKVSDHRDPPRRDWVPVHRLVWKEAHGEIPPGHVVRFKPGMHTTELEKLTVDRIECITRAEHARRNSWHANFPPELKKLVGTRIALTRLTNRRQRELEPSHEQ